VRPDACKEPHQSVDIRVRSKVNHVDIEGRDGSPLADRGQTSDEDELDVARRSVVRSAGAVIGRPTERREPGPQLADRPYGPIVQLQPLPDGHGQGGFEETNVDEITAADAVCIARPGLGLLLADRHFRQRR
jgi:hypothetical protein